MFLYHINVGHPVLAEGSRYLAPIRQTLWAAHEAELRAQKVGYRTLPGPQQRISTSRSGSTRWPRTATGAFRSRSSTTASTAGAGSASWSKRSRAEFPAQYEWQNFQEGQYTHRHRAFDQPRLRQAIRQGPRRADLARARRRAALHDPLRGARRRGRDRGLRAADPRDRRAAGGRVPRADRPMGESSGPNGRAVTRCSISPAGRFSTPAPPAGWGCPTTLLFLEAGARVVAVDNDPAQDGGAHRGGHGASATIWSSRRSTWPTRPALKTELDALLAAGRRLRRGRSTTRRSTRRSRSRTSRIEEHLAVQRVNVDAAIVAVQVALPHMRRAGRGDGSSTSPASRSMAACRCSRRTSPRRARSIGLTRAWAREFGRIRHHGERDLARRLSDRRREDSPRPGRLRPVRARSPGGQAPRTPARYRSRLDVLRLRRTPASSPGRRSTSTAAG